MGNAPRTGTGRNTNRDQIADLFYVRDLEERKRLFETGCTFGVNPQYVQRLHKILALLEISENIHDMDLPGLSPHSGALSGISHGR